MRRSTLFFLTVGLLYLSSCVHAGKGISSIEYISGSVDIVSTDGKFIPNETVYVMEWVYDRRIITEVFKTDVFGKIYLDGYYCAPITIAAMGGSIMIRESGTGTEYVVVLSENPPLSLESTYGHPSDRDLKTQEARRQPPDCG